MNLLEDFQRKHKIKLFRSNEETIIKNFATGEITTDDMKDHNIDLKERQKIARDEFDRRRTEENTKLNYFLTNK